MRECLPPHALEIPQVRQVVLPFGVTDLVFGEPRGDDVSVVQLEGQGNECGELLP